MKAALYPRVSTIEQRKGFSINAQLEALREYAAKMGYTVAGEYVDDGYSAASLMRPALQLMLKDIEAGKIDIVLIFKQDRLSRRVKDIIELVDIFIKYDVKLHSLSETIDWLSSSGRAMLKMMATFSEMERENIAERSKMGKDYKARQGYYSNRHNIPIGYVWDDDNKQLVPHPEEAEQIKKIFELYLSGFSMKKASEYMAVNYKNRYSSYAYKTGIKNILYNPIYAGYFKHCGELIKGKNVVPLVDYETFLRAEKRREDNKNIHAKPDSPYLLIGLIRCGLCGQRYGAKRYDSKGKNKKYFYYRYGCQARLRYDPIYHARKCDKSPFVAFNELEGVVIDRIKKITLKSGRAGAGTGAINIIAEENVTLREKIDKLIDLYTDGLLDKPSLESRLTDLNKKLEKNKMLIDDMKAEIKDMPAVDVALLNEKIRDFDALDYPQRRALLKSIIKEIIIFPEKIDIILNFEQF